MHPLSDDMTGPYIFGRPLDRCWLAAVAAEEGMAEPEKDPLDEPRTRLSSWKASFNRMRRRVGMPVAVLLVLLVAGGIVWWKREDIARSLGLELIIARSTPRPIRKAPIGRLVIAVAHLDRDKDGKHENLLLDELRQFEGAEIVKVDRTVEWPASDTDGAAENKAKTEGQRLFQQTGADALIWGSVIDFDNQRAMRLYWTSAQELRGAKYIEPYQIETIALPSQLDDLKQTLGLLAELRISFLTLNQPTRDVADKLTPLIARVRLLAQSREGVWNLDILAGVEFSLANALALADEQSRNNELLAEGITHYHKVLEQWTRERVPLDWAKTQNYLGNALETLGERESGTGKLEEAVSAYREALEERTRDRAPLQWAATQNNLGNALRVLGERESGTGKLEEAVSAYREALKELTRERAPFDWAGTQMNLGNTLLSLGERESGTGELDAAVSAYREALKEWTSEVAPHWHYIAQENLDRAKALLMRRRNE